MKKKKFAEGGSSFIDDFEAAKKNKAEVVADKVADKVAPVTVPAKSEFQTAEGENEMISKIPKIREKALYYNAPRFIHNASDSNRTGYGKSITPYQLSRKDILNQFPDSPSGRVVSSTDYDDAGYKSGGKVKSASSRADGCCIRGKTRA